MAEGIGDGRIGGRVGRPVDEVQQGAEEGLGIRQGDSAQQPIVPPQARQEGHIAARIPRHDVLQDLQLQPALQAKPPSQWTDGDCKEVIRGMDCNWKKIQDTFKNDMPVLERLAEFRETYIHSLIAGLKDEFGPLAAMRTGSREINSDIDITLAKKRTDGRDVAAAIEFNNRVKREFGKQPGTVFDTNVYVQDYLQIEENLDAVSGRPEKSLAVAQPQYMMRMSRLDQDVVAILKQRRNMDQLEWDDYVLTLTQGIADPGERAIVLRQYEEADAIYKIGGSQLLEKVQAELLGTGLPDPSKNLILTNAEEAEVAGLPTPQARDVLREQLLLSHKLQTLRKNYPDIVLEISNNLYLERMGKVRDLQNEAMKFATKDGRTLLDQTKAEVLVAQTKRLLGEAIFFANEAYHGEGSLLHVVKGSRAESRGVIENLTPHQLLDSVNEQLGDFLKDVNRYRDAPPGEAFYRSSKYLLRMLDAVRHLKRKEGMANLAADFERTCGARLEAIHEGLENTLVPVRKPSTRLGSEMEVEKVELSEDIIANVFNVETADQLKNLILDLAREVNSKVRSTFGFADMDDSGLSEEQHYFAHRIVE